MKYSKFFISLILILSGYSSIGQVKTNFNSKIILTERGKYSMPYHKTSNFVIPSKNISALLQADLRDRASSDQVKPLRIAEPVSVDLDIAHEMNWIVEGVYVFGKFSIYAKDALSLSINFDKFKLPPGSEMYIYNENGEMITGPITDAENNETNSWGSWVLQGEYLNIEIKVPFNSKDDILLHSSNIAYGFREIYKVQGFGDSGACEINVLCPLGNGWEGERNSVALYLNSNGDTHCSGAMIANTCNTNQPLFLTANHCWEADQDENSWRFAFQAWSSTCNPSADSDGLMFNGSTLRARYYDSDFCLVELNDIPPVNSNIHYSGWNASSIPASVSTCIHHPRGDVMKISRANNGAIRASFNSTIDQHWRADWSPQDNGGGVMVTPVTEKGSSGSPLYDQFHRIIGQLHGGPSICSGSSLWDFFGSLDMSWTGGGTTGSRLSDWLDPGNTGQLTLNTINVSSLQDAYPTISIVGLPTSDYICHGSSTYTLNGLPLNAAVIWSISNTNFASIPTPSTGPSVVVTKVGSGVVTLTANITLCGGETEVVKKEIMIGTSVGGYYTIVSDYHNVGIHYPLYNNNSPIFLPPNEGFGIVAYITSPAIQSSTWTRSNQSYPFWWNTTETTLRFSGSSAPSGSRTGIFDLSAQTLCGEYEGTFQWPIVTQTWSIVISISPNPVEDYLHVAINNEFPEILSLDPENEVIITIYDFYNNLVKKLNFNKGQNQFKLDVNELPIGQYILMINQGTNYKSTQFIKVKP